MRQREEGTVPATNKVGTQLLVSPHIKARAQALALVRQEAVAEIYRIALEGAGLQSMEAAHHNALHHLDKALDAIGGDRVILLDTITRKKISYADLFDGETGKPLGRLPEVKGWRGTGAPTRVAAAAR